MINKKGRVILFEFYHALKKTSIKYKFLKNKKYNINDIDIQYHLCYIINIDSQIYKFKGCSIF